jgi:hypothetical protein
MAASFPPLNGPCHCGLEEVCSPLNLTIKEVDWTNNIRLPGNITLTKVHNSKCL